MVQKPLNQRNEFNQTKSHTKQQNTIKVPLRGIEGAFNRPPPTQKSHSPFY